MTPRTAVLMSICLFLPNLGHGQEPPDCKSNPLLKAANSKIDACIEMTDPDAARSCGTEVETGMGNDQEVLVPLMFTCREEVGRIVKTVQALNFYHGSIKKIEELGERIEKAIPFFEENGQFPDGDEPSLTQEWLKLTQAIKQVSNFNQLGAPQLSHMQDEHAKFQQYFDVANWIKDNGIDYDDLPEEERKKIISEGKLGMDGAQVAKDKLQLRKDSQLVHRSLTEIKSILGKGPLDAEQSKHLAALFENARAAGGDQFDEVFRQFAGKDLAVYSKLPAGEIAKLENARALALETGLKTDAFIPAPEGKGPQTDPRNSWGERIDRFLLNTFHDKENDLPPAQHAYLRSLVDPMHKGQPPGTLVYHAHTKETAKFINTHGRLPNDEESQELYSRIFGAPGSDLERLTQRAIKKRSTEQEKEMTNVSANVIGMIPIVGLAEYLIRPPETGSDYGWMGGQMVLTAVGLGMVGKTVKAASKIPPPPSAIGQAASTATNWIKNFVKGTSEVTEAGGILTRAPQPLFKGALQVPGAAAQQYTAVFGKLHGMLPFKGGFVKAYGKGHIVLEEVNPETVRRHFISPLLNSQRYRNTVRSGMGEMIADLQRLQAKGYKYIESVSYHQGTLGSALKNGFKVVDNPNVTAEAMEQMAKNFKILENGGLIPQTAKIFVDASGAYKPVVTRLDIAAELAKLAK